MKALIAIIVSLLVVVAITSWKPGPEKQSTFSGKDITQTDDNLKNQNHKKSIVAEDVRWNGTYKRDDETGEGTLTFSNFDDDVVDFDLDSSMATENGISISAMNDQATVTKTKAVYKDDDSECTITFTHVGNQVVVRTSKCEDENNDSMLPYDGTYIQSIR